MREVARKRIDVWEVTYDDGTVGITIGGDSDRVYQGYDALTVETFLEASFMSGRDLWDLTGEAVRKRKYITVEEIMDMYGVSQKTVYRWNEAGKLHGTKAGRRLLFDEADAVALAGKGEGMNKGPMSTNCE